MRDDASIVPYTGMWYHGGCLFPFGRNMDSGSQGRAMALPRAFAAVQGAGGMRASRPTVVLYVPRRPGNPRVSGARNLCRGGFHIRPGCLRRREPGRYRIGPYIGGYAAADRENRRPRVTSPSVGDDARIVPGGLWWRRVCGRGMPLPYKPRQTPGQTKWTAATALRSFCMYRTNREIHAFPARKNRVGADSISARGVNRADIESAPARKP